MKGSNWGRDVLSARQMMVLLAVVLLAPATDLLPTVAARQVGKGGWLIGFGILPVLLFALWVCSRVFCREEICKTVGRTAGYTIIILYMIWIVFVLAAAHRLSAARMEEIYGNVPSVWISIVLVAVAAWMGTGKVSALARAAEIFYLALTVMLAGILLLALFKMERQNLYPVEWTRIFGGSFRSAGILLNVVPIAVLGLRVPKEGWSAQKIGGWSVAFCAAVTLVLIAVLGCVGSGLSARLEMPYFIMVQGLGIKGAFQRTEALAASVWLLSDLILCAALLRAGSDCVAQITTERWGRWSVPILAAAALAVGWLLFPEEGVRTFCIKVLPVTGVVLGIIFPVILRAFSCVWTKKQR